MPAVLWPRGTDAQGASTYVTCHIPNRVLVTVCVPHTDSPRLWDLHSFVGTLLQQTRC